MQMCLFLASSLLPESQFPQPPTENCLGARARKYQYIFFIVYVMDLMENIIPTFIENV